MGMRTSFISIAICFVVQIGSGAEAAARFFASRTAVVGLNPRLSDRLREAVVTIPPSSSC